MSYCDPRRTEETHASGRAVWRCDACGRYCIGDRPVAIACGGRRTPEQLAAKSLDDLPCRRRSAVVLELLEVAAAGCCGSPFVEVEQLVGTCSRFGDRVELDGLSGLRSCRACAEVEP